MKQGHHGAFWPGYRWRILAHGTKKRGGRNPGYTGEQIDLDSKSHGNLMEFDELAIDDWFHLEQMDARNWWMSVGNGDDRWHVNVQIDPDGKASVEMERSMRQNPENLVVPDYVEPVIGWRTWNIVNGRLVSLFSNDTWEPDVPFEARCLFHWSLPFIVTGVTGWTSSANPMQHHSPSEGCTCGIYAADNRRRAQVFTSPSGRYTVTGKVALWGKVVPGERGWRAQYAYPVELYASDKRLIKSLSAYGVPVGRPRWYERLGLRSFDVLGLSFSLPLIGVNIAVFFSQGGYYRYLNLAAALFLFYSTLRGPFRSWWKRVQP